jgi:hypothetical protein
MVSIGETDLFLHKISARTSFWQPASHRGGAAAGCRGLGFPPLIKEQYKPNNSGNIFSEYQLFMF